MNNWVCKIKGYKTTFLSKENIKRFLLMFVSVFGFQSAVLSVIDICYRNSLTFDKNWLFGIIFVSCVLSLIKVLPIFSITRQLFYPDVKIKVKVGDLFNETNHLVIGMNDVFDTDTKNNGKIIKENSIQGQFLEKIYKGDLKKLDLDLSNALKNFSGKVDKSKTQGKNIRYPIGTIATIDKNRKKYFCVAYSKMSNKLEARSSLIKLWKSLEFLWKEVSLKSQSTNVSVPIIGSELSRVCGVTHLDLIKIIILSFIISSRKKNYVTKEITLIIHPCNLEKINMLQIKNFINEF